MLKSVSLDMRAGGRAGGRAGVQVDGCAGVQVGGWAGICVLACMHNLDN